MASDFKIGTSIATLTSLDSLTVWVPDPRSYFQQFSRLLDLGSGLKRGAGFPITTWTYGYLTQAQREELRSYCPRASSEVYIRTRTNDEDDSEPIPSLFKVFKAVMIWPEGEENQASRRLDLVITFSRLEEQVEE